MAKSASDYIQTINPKGYVNNREITNTDSRFLVAPSKNTLIRNNEKVVSRKGYTLKGAAKTINRGIYASTDWKMSNNAKRSLRGYDDELEVWYDNSWVRLKNGWTSTLFQFLKEGWWDTTHQLDRMLFVNGTADLFSWSGAITDVLSITTNTITKKYYIGGITFSFTAATRTIADSGNNFVTHGFAAGQTIIVANSTSNDGEYLIESVTAGAIVLADTDTLTDEAAGTTLTIRVKGRGTWGEERFYATGTHKKIVINDIEYTYTGGETTGTLTGVTPDPTGNVAADDIALQAVETDAAVIASTFYPELISMLNNHVFVASTKNREVYMSKSSDFADFGYTSPLRVPTEGFEMTLDATPTGFIPDEDVMYIGAGEDDFFEVIFSLNAAQQGETIVIKKLKTSLGQAPLNQGSIVHIKNNVAFLNFEPTIDTLGRVQNIDTDQSLPISDDIRNLLESLDRTNAHGFYFKRELLFAFPEEGIVLIYNLRFGYWHPPQEIPIARFALIDGQLCGHSHRTNETYVLFDGLNDNGGNFTAVAAFGYENYGTRFDLKNFDELAAEVRISRSTVLDDRILYEEDGSGGEATFEIDAGNPLQVFSKDDEASLGQSPLGSNPLGGLITTISELVKVKKIHTTPALDFFERQRIFSSDSEDVQFEILAFGENAQLSGNEPDFIKD